MLILRPFTVKRALPFIRKVHRRLLKIQGALWAVSAWNGDEMIGVAVVGFPGRGLMVDDTLCVLRGAVIDGQPNCCPMVYGSWSPPAGAVCAPSMSASPHGAE